MTYLYRKYNFYLLAMLLLVTANIQGQDDGTLVPGDPATGKSLWNENACGTCHIKNMKDNGTGPALGGVEGRWAAEPREHLYRWVRGSQALISSGESARAIAVYEENNNNLMQNYPGVTDQDVEHLLAFINGVYEGTYPPKPAGATIDVGATQVAETDNTWLFIILGLALLLLSIILARVTSNLSYMVDAAEGDAPATRRTLAQILTSKGVIAFLIFAIVVFGGYNVVNSAIDLGRQQDYQPEQPIKFSHVTHAGVNKIECQYCHDGARRSKHSIIPAVNTCMNCHAAIKYGSNYGTAELTKIYASVGWDPNTGQYIEGYEDYTREQIYEVFGNWISSQYLAKDGDVDQVDEVVEEQLAGITAALTNGEDDTRIPGPVEWVRIHNMPDHVYFNHAQHVTVGKIDCQNCHGPVEEMEVVYQYSPLSMGWCINCHRVTDVDFKDNGYYDSYKIYHEEIQNGERSGVTVEEVGGLNCQKCHY